MLANRSACPITVEGTSQQRRRDLYAKISFIHIGSTAKIGPTLPAHLSLPASQEVGIMQMRLEWRINSRDTLRPRFFTREDFTICFIESEVRRVPVQDRIVLFPGAGVDGILGVVFHEFHGWMGAGYFVPSAILDECWLSWVSHGGYLELQLLIGLGYDGV